MTRLFGLLLATSLAFAGTENKIPVVTTNVIKKVETSNVLYYPARAQAKINAVILAESDGVVTKILPLGSRIRRNERILNITQTDPIYNFAPFKVTSPVSGAISEIFVTEGTRVSKGEKLATVTDPSQLQLTLEATPADLKEIRRGLKGMFRLESQKESADVIVTGVSPYINSTTGTSTVVAEIANAKGLNILPGTLGQIEFKTASRSTVIVPDSAVIYRGNETFVRTVKDSKAVFKKVQVGQRSLDTVEIVSGVSENDIYIERASRFVADGAPVETQKEKSAN